MASLVLLDLMSAFHFLSQLHGWLMVCPKGAVFTIHPFDFAHLRRGRYTIQYFHSLLYSLFSHFG